MRLMTQPYSLPETMQAWVSMGVPSLFSSKLLSVDPYSSCAIGLAYFPLFDWISYNTWATYNPCLTVNIVTHKTSNVTKELRNSLISSTHLICIPCMHPAVNSPMAKIIAWESITIKWTYTSMMEISFGCSFWWERFISSLLQIAAICPQIPEL